MMRFVPQRILWYFPKGGGNIPRAMQNAQAMYQPQPNGTIIAAVQNASMPQTPSLDFKTTLRQAAAARIPAEEELVPRMAAALAGRHMADYRSLARPDERLAAHLRVVVAIHVRAAAE